MKKWTHLILIFVVLTSLLMGCAPSQPAKTTEDTPPKLEKVVVVLDWTPNTNHTGLYVAKDLKYYEAEGLEVEIIQPSDAGAANLVEASKANFGISYQEEVTMARTADTPVNIKAIAAIIQHNDSGFASPKDRNIKQPKDFVGKTYGSWGSPVETATIKALMEQDGSSFDQTKIADIGEMDFFASFDTGIDYRWIFYGWDGIAAELKGYPMDYLKVADYDKALDYYTPVLITSDTLAKEKPELVKKFLSATAKGYQYAIDSPDQAADILLKNVPELDPDLVQASQQYLADKYAPDAKWGTMKEEIWQNYAQWLLDRELIPRPLAVKEAYTNEFLPQ